ncbi:unnamed protein product [Larinioides sclopetarius]|uniref:ARF7 effector protein C-terminal domain-containing protein n=1 Tax=Larinioides sclopetarius TaxID=280406 RepID=A0AAV1ZGC1_9ARAC
MAESDGSSMNLTDRETEVEPKGHSNQASAAESAGGNKVSIQAGVESHDQGPKKQVKRTRKVDGRRTKYTSEGIHKASQQDLCDCLIPDCPGCFMPCKKCSSNKCGHECRNNRRWVYENIHVEGSNMNIEFPFKK